ncbi:MAG: GNAT family N-acetyltransferase, partial [Myxococcota bacterium]|nr:GNAT family N-acetyltransferase [Myxococcota bacterium]
HGVLRLRVMPYWADEDAAVAEHELRRVGFRDVQQPDGTHASTLRLDIAGRADGALFGDQVKSRLRLAEKAGVTARRGTAEDWPALRSMHAALMRSQGLREKPQAWWAALQAFSADDRRGALFACDLGERLVAAAVILRHGSQATYSWGASIPDKMPFTKAIPPLVAAIRWSREAGCATFDLGGIPLEEDHDPKRNAIAAFKLYFTKSRVRLVREHGK